MTDKKSQFAACHSSIVVTVYMCDGDRDWHLASPLVRGAGPTLKDSPKNLAITAQKKLPDAFIFLIYWNPMRGAHLLLESLQQRKLTAITRIYIHEYLYIEEHKRC